ncbi:MAG: ATP-binding protein [Bacteroidota bacterium]
MNPTKILVVDDEPLIERMILQRLRREVRDGKYQFLFAEDGVEALSVIDDNADIDMVVTDLNMPRMDGLTLVEKIRSIKPLLKTIILSAYGDMKNIRKTMNLGAFDFLVKPLNVNELKLTIEKTVEAVSILEQAKKAKVLEEENKRLEQMAQMKKQFFTDISHEFRTPLSIILGMTEQIEKNPDKWVSKGVPTIRRNANELLDLVSHIVDLRKLELGRTQVFKETFEFKYFLEGLVDPFKFYAESKNIDLHVLNNLGNQTIHTDKDKVKKIIKNLLSNALKLTPFKGNIYLIINKVKEELNIQVKDSGDGIPEDQIPHIFNRFFQSDKNSHVGRIGSGIGLAIVKEFVNSLNGKIEVVSEAGHGSTFIVNIPLNNMNHI